MRYGISRLSFPWSVLIVYAAFVFISTWAINFLNFKFIENLIGINFKKLDYDGDFWGLTVLEEDDLMDRIIKFTMFLVFGVIGY